MMMFVKHFASNRVAEVVQVAIIRKIGRNTEQEIQCQVLYQGIFKTRILDALHKYFCIF